MEIRDKVVVITGASEGIGAACADELRRRGARLSLNARREIDAPSDLVTRGDLTDPDTPRLIIENTVARFGRIDILINNAGAGLYGSSWNTPLADARRLYELNLFAPLNLIQHAAPHMRRQQSGMIVNVASIAGKVTLPWLTLYSASKFALASMTDGMRMELARDGIHTMTVCPGYVSTNFQRNILGGNVPSSVAEGKWFRVTPQQVAAGIADGIERNKRTVLIPRSGWAFVIARRLFPATVDARLEKILFRDQTV